MRWATIDRTAEVQQVVPYVKVLNRYVARAAYCFIRSLKRFWTILLGYEPKPVPYSRV